jgi:intraflagellar transport protein 74
MSGARPPSARPPTGGIPVGMRPPSRTRGGGDIPPPSRVSIVNRPISGQGLPSAHTQSGTRQVADKSYFIGILRTKINEIMEEIKRLEAENEQRKRGQSIQVGFAEQVSELRKEIAASEAELADYNVLQDRLRQSTTADDMAAGYASLQQRNKQYEERVNKIFKEKRELESVVVDQEKKVESAMSGEGFPELQTLAREIESLEGQCRDLRSQTGDLAGKSREELLQVVKEATASIGDSERAIQDEQKAFNYIQGQLRLLDQRDGDMQTEQGQKYLRLLEREKDMNRFIQNYPQTMESIKQDLADAQRRVLDTLMATSRDLESVQDMPTVDNWKQMQTDLAYKERQMQDAQATMQKLQAEVMQRRREFEDLKNVDQKIEDEIQQSKERMAEMEAEMPKFGDVDAVREEGEARKTLKTQERDQLKAQFENLRKVTNALATRFNEAKAAFRSDEIGRKLTQLEKEIRTQAAENNTTAESIEDNRRRTNYTLVKRQALGIVAEINAML